MHGYRVEALVGAGSMGRVWRVRHLERGTLHALKALPLASASQRQRLLREAEVQLRLHHPNVVSLTEVLDLRGDPGLVMEFVNGPSLEAWMQGRTVEIPAALTLFRGIVGGVAHAHRHGLVHRDLKPSNILLARTPGGLVPKVADFGVAKALEAEGGALTRTGTALGAAAYTSPEQLRDPRDVDARTDVFSLGCVLYELVCGRRPFDGPDALAILNAMRAGDYAAPSTLRPDLPREVARAIKGCLAADRDARLSSCEALLAALDPPAPRPSRALPVALLLLASAAVITVLAWWVL